MLQQPNLSKQLKQLNAIIEDVKNWWFMLKGKEYGPPKYPMISFFAVEHENVEVKARVELWAIGEIYKRIIISGKDALLEEMGEYPFITVFERLLGQPERDANLPSMPVFGDNQVMYVARYWPPGDYVKQLVEHRNLMSMEEFAKIADALDKTFKSVGAGDKLPNYIKPKPFAQVPRLIH